MMAGYDDDAYFGGSRQMNDALSAVEDERQRLIESSALRREQRTTVRAKDNSLSMTFDGRGELVDLTFHGTKFRSMAPKELSTLIVTTLQRGRVEAIETMMSSSNAPSLPGVDLVGLATGKVDPSDAVDAILGPLMKGVSGADGRGFPGSSRA